MSNNYKYPIIIYNPKSGGGKSKKLFNKYYKLLKEQNFFNKIDVFESYSKQETINKIVEIHNYIHDLIISIGGDGSISTICNGLMKIDKTKRLPLFPLPGGSGNSLILDFNVYSVKDSIRNFKKNITKLIDVLLLEEINGNFKWYCANVIGLGFVSNIAKYGIEKFNKFGAFKYILGTFHALKEFKPYSTRIIYNNGKKIFNSNNAYFITLSNTKYTGGKVMIAPDAKNNDGLMDVVILHDINRLKFLMGYKNAFKGKHINNKGCFYFKTGDVEIHSKPKSFIMPDGELEGISPIKVKVIPKQIKLVI